MSQQLNANFTRTPASISSTYNLRSLINPPRSTSPMSQPAITNAVRTPPNDHRSFFEFYQLPNVVFTLRRPGFGASIQDRFQCLLVNSVLEAQSPTRLLLSIDARTIFDKVSVPSTLLQDQVIHKAQIHEFDNQQYPSASLAKLHSINYQITAHKRTLSDHTTQYSISAMVRALDKQDRPIGAFREGGKWVCGVGMSIIITPNAGQNTNAWDFMSFAEVLMELRYAAHELFDRQGGRIEYGRRVDYDQAYLADTWATHSKRATKALIWGMADCGVEDFGGELSA